MGFNNHDRCRRALMLAGAAAVAWGALTAGTAGAEVLVNQRRDTLQPLLSVENMDFGWAITVDDVIFRRNVTLNTLSVQFFVEWGDSLPDEWRLSIFEDNGEGRPVREARDVFVTEQESMIDVWINGADAWEVWEVEFDLDSLRLAKGTYWFSAQAVKYGARAEKAVFWASSQTGRGFNSGALLHCPELGINDWREMAFNNCAPVDACMKITGRGGDLTQYAHVPIRTMRILQGDLLGGSAEVLNQTDREIGVFQSEYQAGSGQEPTLLLEFKYRVPGRLDVAGLYLKFHCKITDDAGIGEIQVKNWQTGQWNTVKEFAVNRRDEFYPVDNLNPRRYIKSNGLVMVRVLITTPVPSTEEGFQALSEQMRADVRLQD